MHLPLLENLLWGVGTALKVSLCLLALYRHLYRRLPLFTVYLSLLPAEVAVVWWAYRHWGYTSREAWYAYWCALGVVVTARGLVIAELCRTTLRKFPGIWSFTKKILMAAAIVLLTWAFVAATWNSHRIVAFVLTLERGLELAGAFILVALYGITVHYKLWLQPVERNAILGLALYSTFQILNSTFLSRQMAAYFSWWESARVACFDFAMLLWLFPLLKPLPAKTPPPPIISEQASLDLLTRVLGKMRALAEEVKRLGKTMRK